MRFSFIVLRKNRKFLRLLFASASLFVRFRFAFCSLCFRVCSETASYLLRDRFGKASCIFRLFFGRKFNRVSTDFVYSSVPVLRGNAGYRTASEGDLKNCRIRLGVGNNLISITYDKRSKNDQILVSRKTLSQSYLSDNFRQDIKCQEKLPTGVLLKAILYLI
ncbi:hypothetical protein SAMN05661099_0966 [Daejeonella lutea]|uniref:Secreted protein n=1 Tax=Daejeonella lutea TaxID=572036 RepID=A0A1T5ARA3_9SPHI|nr:hypothetical protein SAMN05661099_0966 [Daejeonella lutea]